MSLLNGFLNRLMGKKRDGNKDGHERGRIERLCRELGWPIENMEEMRLILHFNDPARGGRKVWINDGDSSLVSVTVFSLAKVAKQKNPAQVVSYLLQRNRVNPIGAWNVCVDSKGDTFFMVKYYARGVGLNAQTFKFICEDLIDEAVSFDKKMRRPDWFAE